MRTLVTIPHYCDPEAQGSYGSLRDRDARARSLLAAVLSLHRSFSDRSWGAVDGAANRVRGANGGTGGSLTVLICTTSGKHALDALPRALFKHASTDLPPRRLGYACHALLRKGIGHFDVFGYLEDDLLVRDPSFLRKLLWFGETFGDDAVLLPNRFELDRRGARPHKLYIDGPTHRDLGADRFQDRSVAPRLEAEVLGEPVRFVRPSNPHSGCFFLTAGQMQRWADSEHFLDFAADFGGPLESAATLGVMRSFRLFKPAFVNAGFLEVEHADPRYLTADPVAGFIGGWLRATGG